MFSSHSLVIDRVALAQRSAITLRSVLITPIVRAERLLLFFRLFFSFFLSLLFFPARRKALITFR